MKRALVIWFFVAALIAMGCSPPPENVDTFGIMDTLSNSNPWVEIWDWYDLDAIRNDLSASYVLMTDLDSTTAGYEEVAGPEANDGRGWEPIGYDTESFTGMFDGGGFSIGNLLINLPGEFEVGLFSRTGSGALVKDLGLENSSISGYYHVGALIGRNGGVVSGSFSLASVEGGGCVGGLVGTNDGTVSDCHTAGSVSGGHWMGGLVGANGGTISGSSSAASVTGSGHGIGGLVGINYDRGTISASNSVGSVSGRNPVGGLVGSNSGPVSSCYSTGYVYASYDDAGGLAGTNASTGTIWGSYSTSTVVSRGLRAGGLVAHNNGAVSNCYATGSVSGRSDVGGLVGLSYGTILKCYSTRYTLVGRGTVSDSFWDVEVSGQTSGPGTGKTTMEMMDIATFTDTETAGLDQPWDMVPLESFDPSQPSTWYIDQGDDYPRLYFQNPDYPPPTLPVATTEPVTDITSSSATLNMEFAVGDYSPVEVRFNWRESGTDAWLETTWTSKAADGTHAETLTGLDSNTTYEFKAQLKYGDTVIEGDTLTFTTAVEPVLTYDLTISSTDDGSVTEPGEGTRTYEDGAVVDLVAVPDTGYHFVNWTGDVGTVSSVDSAETKITMNGDYSIVANFEPVEGGQTQCTATATGTGIACLTTSHGTIENLKAIPPHSLPSVLFPHGMFDFKITGLTPGQTVTLTIEFPSPLPIGTLWWKYDNGRWYALRNESDDGDNIMVISLTDGGVHDLDDVPGQITDPGGPGNPMTVGWDGSPINKAAVMVPWVGLLAAIAGASLLLLRRRRAVG